VALGGPDPTNPPWCFFFDWHTNPPIPDMLFTVPMMPCCQTNIGGEKELEQNYDANVHSLMDLM
jgi:hypothetical protein